MQLQVTDSALSHQDRRQAVKAVLRAWLPLSEAVLAMAAECMPSPEAAASRRMDRLLPRDIVSSIARELPAEAAGDLGALASALASSSAAEDAHLVVYVSKMVSVPAAVVPRRPGEPGPSGPHEERFLAFGRVYSGVVREGMTVQVLSAKYDPRRPEDTSHRQQCTVTGLYLMMGRLLERVVECPAGNVVALGGLDQAILKSATLSSTTACPPFAQLQFQAAPIVRVAIEPALPQEMPRLVEGLRLLNRADPFVEASARTPGPPVPACN